jgi:hypothetical protein
MHPAIPTAVAVQLFMHMYKYRQPPSSTPDRHSVHALFTISLRLTHRGRSLCRTPSPPILVTFLRHCNCRRLCRLEDRNWSPRTSIGYMFPSIKYDPHRDPQGLQGLQGLQDLQGFKEGEQESRPAIEDHHLPRTPYAPGLISREIECNRTETPPTIPTKRNTPIFPRKSSPQCLARGLLDWPTSNPRPGQQ